MHTFQPLTLLWAWALIAAVSATRTALQCPGAAHLKEVAPDTAAAAASRPEFPSRKLTLEGWVWLNNNDNKMDDDVRAGLLSYSIDTGDGGNETLAFSAVAEATGGLVVVLHGIETSLKGPDLIRRGRWTHVAVVWDTTTGGVRGFVDSHPQGESLFEANVFIPPGGTIRVAAGARVSSDARVAGYIPLGDANSVVELRLWSATFAEKQFRQSLMLSPNPLDALERQGGARARDYDSDTTPRRLVRHWRLTGNSTASFTSLHSGTDEYSVVLEDAAGGSDTSCGSTVRASPPLCYTHVNYDRIDLNGIGLASQPSYNVNAGPEASIVSFGDDNSITTSSGKQQTLNAQMTNTLSGLEKTDKLTSTDGVQVLGTGQVSARDFSFPPFPLSTVFFAEEARADTNFFHSSHPTVFSSFSLISNCPPPRLPASPPPPIFYPTLHLPPFQTFSPSWPGSHDHFRARNLPSPICAGTR